MKTMKIFGAIFILSVLIAINGESKTQAFDKILDYPYSGVISQETTDRKVNIEDNELAQVSDPDLEPGFPVKTWHDAGTYMGGPAVNTRVGNIDADPELEILVSGLARGPLYAFNYDGTMVPGWPVAYYARTHYTTLGNLNNQIPGFEIFTGQFVLQVPEAPPGPMLVYSGEGNLLAGWPKDSVIDIWGDALLADVNDDYLDEIFIYEGDFKLHAYLANGNSLAGWPEDSSDPSYAASDLDGDGDLEFVTFKNSTSEGAYLVAYHHNGMPVDNFSLFFQPYRHPFPVIGDVDGDGSNETIVFSYIEEDPYFALYIVGPTGSLERIIPLSLNSTQGEPSASPALADLDNDHIPEIIVGCAAGLLVYKGDGSILPGFPVKWGNPNNARIGNSAPIVGDVDGDQKPDIVLTANLYGSTINGQIYVYNSNGQPNPHFPKTIRIGTSAVPAIADIDLDGRNEIVITGDYWDGNPGFYDKVWMYDLHGSDYGKIDWGQLGGSPQHWGSYPAPPAYPGVNLLINTPENIGSNPGDIVNINIRYSNLGVMMASSVIMTATLDVDLSYISDTSGITPTIDGQNIIWNLPNIGYLFERQFNLMVKVSPDSIYGDLFTASFVLSSEQLDADPSNNISSSNIKIVRQTFLAFIQR